MGWFVIRGWNVVLVMERVEILRLGVYEQRKRAK